MARVLIAEDDAQVRALYAAWLTAAGHQVDEAADGGTALAKALAGGIDALLLDVILPAPDGIEIIKRLQAAGVSLPILCISGGSAAVPADVALMVSGMFGADRILYKPIARETLVKAVAEAVG